MKSREKLRDKFFAQFPPTHAIPRLNEALAIWEINFVEPILDLGCGNGKFALLTFGRGKLEVGLDQSEKEAGQARESGAYKRVVVAEAAKMPFAEENFSSVVANSVLEHVENLDRVLAEVARVLRKGGILVLSVPTPLVSDYQFWARFIPQWAQFKTKLWRHVNYFGESKWRQKLKKAGFKVQRIKKTNSRQAIMWADIFFPFFWVGPTRWLAGFLFKQKIFGLDKDGATLVIVAKKI